VTIAKRAGRPPLDPDDHTVRVGISLPARQFDAYARRALAEDVSVPEDSARPGARYAGERPQAVTLSRRRGQRPLVEGMPTAQVTVRLIVADFDRTYQIAA